MKKYLHIFEQTAEPLTSSLIKMYNSDLNLHDYNTFYTKDKIIYENNKDEKNVFYDTDMVKVINDEFVNYDYIFIHAMNFSITELLKIRKEAKQKFIWLTWGHDLYGYDSNSFIMFLKQIKLRMRIALLKEIYGLGYTFEYDAIQAQKLLPKTVKTLHIPYLWSFKKGDSFDGCSKDHSKLNVLIGHCGFNFIEHIKVMKQLKKIYNENMVINLVLSYGGTEKYIEKVKKYAFNNFDKADINIIDKKMSEREYTEFLSTIDVAIFEYKHSCGLGNIYRLLHLGKKIYLNKNGIIYKGLSSVEKMPLFKTEDIGKSFDDFSNPLSAKEEKICKDFAFYYASDESVLKLWSDFFNKQ